MWTQFIEVPAKIEADWNTPMASIRCPGCQRGLEVGQSDRGRVSAITTSVDGGSLSAMDFVPVSTPIRFGGK
jgi:hypothetical protein